MTEGTDSSQVSRPLFVPDLLAGRKSRLVRVALVPRDEALASPEAM
jgi:hypothetical protein